MPFGMPFTMFKSGNTFGCVKPGFWNSSNDNTRPTTDCVFPFGGDGLSFNVGVVEVVGKAVPIAGVVGADTLVADASAVGALLVSVDVLVVVLSVGVATEFGTVLRVDTVAGKDWVVGTDVVEVGLAGFTGDTGFVGLVADFLQVSDVVTQGCHTGLPYGFGHVEERVWVMLPV